jgi:hypothetical protein
MTLEIVQHRLDRLLAMDEPRVVLLTGGWGSGKTYQWKKALRTARGLQHVPRYAYVSLFGLTSLAEVRKRMSEEISSSVNIPGNVESLADLVEDRVIALKPWKLNKLLPAIPYLNKLDSLMNDLSFMAVRNAVICFDDLERCGPGLRLADVFGLASFLKEERNCRIVIISDQTKLTRENQGDLATYLEKVVDESVHFAPTPQEACTISFGDKPAYALGLLRDRLVELGVSNIRVIGRLGKMAVILQDLLKDLHEATLRDAVHALAIFGASHFLPTDGYPTTEFLKGIGGTDWNRYFHEKKADAEQTAAEKIESDWRTQIERYGYRETSPLDLEILIGVQRGYFDEKAVLAAATSLSMTAAEMEIRSTYHDAWHEFWHSMDGDTEAMFVSLRTITLTALAVIGASDLHTAYSAFKDAGKDAIANELLDKFIESNQHRFGVFAAVDGSFGEQYSVEFATRLRDEYVKHVPPANVEAALDAIDFRSGWNPADIELVAAASFAEIEPLLAKAKGRVFTKRITTLLQIGIDNSANEKEKQLRSNTIAFLKGHIAATPLLGIRLRRFLPKP